MPEFLQLLPPEEAPAVLFSSLPNKKTNHEKIETALSLGRVIAEDISAPHSLPGGLRIRPAEVGGPMALGITHVSVAPNPSLEKAI